MSETFGSSIQSRQKFVNKPTLNYLKLILNNNNIFA